MSPFSVCAFRFGVFASEWLPVGMPLVEYAGEMYIHPKHKRFPPPQLAELRWAAGVAAAVAVARHCHHAAAAT